MTNHQRKGSISNAHAGKEFEKLTKLFLEKQCNITLSPKFSVPIGISGSNTTKNHDFDLGCSNNKILVECKSHNWTETGNVPSAKLTVWNEAMFYFYLAPSSFTKILFVLKANHPKHGQKSLADYYVEKHSHLIPLDVTIIEYDTISHTANKILKSTTKENLLKL